MEWIILFLVSWIILFLLVEWKKFKFNMWCGLLAVAFQFIIDSTAMEHKLYEIKNPILHIMGSSVFFGFGPVFVIGTLLAQYQPAKRWMAVLHVIVLICLYSVEELLLLSRQVLLYTNWHFPDSMFLNLISMTALSWFSLIVLNRRGTKA